MADQKGRNIVLKIFKIFGWIIASVVALLILVGIAVQIPWVQNKVKKEAISFLEGKLGTRVELAHFSLSFPKKVVLEGIYFEDQKKDTLLYAGRLGIDTDLWALTDNTIELKQVELENFTSRISRSSADSAFNFDYIIKAFTSDSTQVDTTASTPWKFVLGDINLSQLHLSLDDSLSGNHVNLQLGELAVSIDRFDLDSSIVAIDDIKVARLRTEITQSKLPTSIPDSVEVVPEDSSAIAFNFGFKEIVLEEIDVSYNQRALGQVAVLSLPRGRIEANLIDIKKQLIDLASIDFQDSYISYDQMPTDYVALATSTADVGSKPESQEPWQFTLGALDLSGITVQFNNFSEPIQKGMVDFNHLWLTNLTTRVRDVKYTEDEIRATISQFAFAEKSGFRVNSFRSTLLVQPDSMALSGFNLRTANSLLKMEGKAKYKSIATLSDNLDQMLFSFILQPSTLSMRDALYFNPSLKDSLGVAMDPNTTVRLDAAARGTLRDLTLERLQFHGLENTSLFANGRFKDVLDPQRMSYNVYVDRLYTTSIDIKRILPASAIPATIEIPSWISLKGHYQGTLKTPDTKTNLTSEFGAMDLHARLDLTDGIKENYKGEVIIHDFNVGRLLKQPDQIGRLDMVAAVNGSGMEMKDLDAAFKVRVNRFGYSGYTYRDLKVDGTMKKYFFNGKASLLDENLDFVLTADLDYEKEAPRYKVNFDLRNADLKKLKLTPRPMKTRGQLLVDMETPDFKKLNGKLDIRKFAIFNGEQLYAVDSLLFASIDQEGQSEINIKSDIMSGEFKGTINIFSLPEVLGRHFNRYFALKDTLYEKPLENQDFKFNMVIKNTDLITEVLVPELEPFVPGRIAGEFNSAKHKLELLVNLAEINYSGIAMDTISFKAISDEKSFDFTLSLKDILIDTLNIKALRFAGNVMNDSIRTNFMILDSLEQEKYFLGGVFNSFEDAFQFRFLKNHLVLNYEEWDTPLYNSLRFTDRGLDPNNFLIRNGDQRILMLKKNNADSTLSLVFNAVDLKNITSLVEGTTPLGGLIDGELMLASAREGAFETELKINQLEILEQEWGNLAFNMTKDANTPMNFKLDLRGTNADLSADGFVGSDADPDMLIRAKLARLNLAIAEPLAMGQLKKLTGSLTGEFTVQGKTKDPEMFGKLNFREVKFHSTFTNTDFQIANESIFLRDDELVFDKFEIMDSKRNKASIDGLVSSNPQGGFDLRLNLKANNFQLINTTENDNDLFYGKAWLNTTATITGNSFQPVIRMDVSLSENSDVTYVVPQSEKGVMEQKGIVVFIDQDAVNDPFMKSIDPKDTVKVGFTGMDLTANIELSDKEKFNVVIDPITGDKLSVRGNSTLTLHMDPTGDMQLSGRYEISEGTYDLSFARFVKRNFVIDKGSTIIWTGDPLNGQMDIRAIYTVETSPIDLVAPSGGDVDDIYKKETPFLVYLILKGELLFPEVSFRLDMPERHRNEYNGSVYPLLQDINQRESDLNKQVFALLILKRFISDNPFESEGGGTLAGSARKSVSKLLTEQLNRLSSNVKGVELTFDLKSYEDAAQGGAAQTDLQLGLSKSLMNDRLIVKVSGNVNLEGQQQEQSSITDFIGDLALEYKLTEDGRLRVTGFRNSNYDMIDGDLIETGAGVIYVRDYDTLKELFKANDTENK